MRIIKDVLNQEELVSIYNEVIDKHSWYLSRGSNKGHLRTGTFPGLIVFSNNNIMNQNLFDYFESLLPRIQEKNLEQHDFGLPENIARIDLVAKQQGASAEFHIDYDRPNAYSLIGMLSPEWDESWGGEFRFKEEVWGREFGDYYLDVKSVNHSPGNFIMIESNQLHCGLGPKVETPYWRIVVNYILV